MSNEKVVFVKLIFISVLLAAFVLLFGCAGSNAGTQAGEGAGSEVDSNPTPQQGSEAGASAQPSGVGSQAGRVYAKGLQSDFCISYKKYAPAEGSKKEFNAFVELCAKGKNWAEWQKLGESDAKYKSVWLYLNDEKKSVNCYSVDAGYKCTETQEKKDKYPPSALDADSANDQAALVDLMKQSSEQVAPQQVAGVAANCYTAKNVKSLGKTGDEKRCFHPEYSYLKVYSAHSTSGELFEVKALEIPAPSGKFEKPA